MGFERFALGVVPSRSATRNTILIDNLGKHWWKIARGDEPDQARQLFIDLLMAHEAAYRVPKEVQEAIAARLEAAGQYSSDYGCTVAPVETKIGTAYLLVLGDGNRDINDTTMVRLTGVAAITVLNWRRLTGGGGAATLTPRETEILTLVADGQSSAMIADQLKIAARTVEAHLASAMNKLAARNRTAAVVAAIRNGMIDV